MLFVADRKASGTLRPRAESHGYVDHAGEHPDLALIKLQPLSLRAALTEARFLEAEVAGRQEG